MAGVWSEQRKLERWLEVELAALDAWAEIGARAGRGGGGDPARRGRTDAGARARDRGANAPRRRGVRRRRRGGTRRARPLVPLRAHVLGRARHGALAADPGGGPADPRRHRPRVHRGRRPGGGAPADADDRANPRRARRADDARAEARGLGVRARAGPHARRACARGPARRKALRRGRDVLGDRPGRRANRVRAARARACADLDTDPRSATGMRSC